MYNRYFLLHTTFLHVCFFFCLLGLFGLLCIKVRSTSIEEVSLSRVSAHNKVRPQHGELRTLLFLNHTWVLLHRIVNNEEWQDGVYGLSSLTTKPRESNHLQMSLQRQHCLLSHLKTLSVGPARVQTHDLPHGDTQPTDLTTQWI